MSKIIGIAGGTASGKSTISKKIAKLYEENYSVKIIQMDWHYKNKDLRPKVQSHISGTYYIDDNCPTSINWDSFHEAIEEAINENYDFIIIEGLFVLYDEYLKPHLDLRVYVDCRSDERVVRRLKRNMGWGMDFDDIASVYLDMVRFRHDQYVEPTKWTADIIVNGSGNTDFICQMIYKSLI